MVYVDETDDKAIETALFRASRAYRRLSETGQARRHALWKHALLSTPRCSSAAASPAASEIMQHLFDGDYLLKNDLVFIGSPDTVAAKIRAAAKPAYSMCFSSEFIFRICPRRRCCALSTAVRRESDFGSAPLYEPF